MPTHKELVFATANPTKLTYYGDVLNRYGYQLIAPAHAVEVDEVGVTPAENARLKAVAYAMALGRPALATDDALYFHGVPEEDQPGLNVRRIPGGPARPSDEEMLAYYMALIRRHGGKLIGHWESAFSMASRDGSSQEISLRWPNTHFVDTPAPAPMNSLPLSLLQVHPVTGEHTMFRDETDPNSAWHEPAIHQRLVDFFATIL